MYPHAPLYLSNMSPLSLLYLPLSFASFLLYKVRMHNAYPCPAPLYVCCLISWLSFYGEMLALTRLAGGQMEADKGH